MRNIKFGSLTCAFHPVMLDVGDLVWMDRLKLIHLPPLNKGGNKIMWSLLFRDARVGGETFETDEVECNMFYKGVDDTFRTYCGNYRDTFSLPLHLLLWSVPPAWLRRCPPGHWGSREGSWCPECSCRGRFAPQFARTGWLTDREENIFLFICQQWIKSSPCLRVVWDSNLTYNQYQYISI